jgi:hypothetical protein
MTVPAVRILCLLAALGAAAVSFQAGTIPFMVIASAVLVLLSVFVSRDREEARILILGTGELLVIATAAAFYPAGTAVQCAIIGAVLFDRPGLPEQRDVLVLALWCLAALAGAAVLYFSAQVLLPFLALTLGVAGATALIIGVQELRERRLYAGGTE